MKSTRSVTGKNGERSDLPIINRANQCDKTNTVVYKLRDDSRSMGFLEER